MAEVAASIIESRVEYVAGSLILLARWAVRLRVRAWYWDDWFSVSVFIWHTALFAMVEYVSIVGAPLGFTKDQRESLTPEMTADLTNGAKGMYASFFILINFVWSAKAVLIVFFMRLTRQTHMYTYMLWVVGISIACWLAACLVTFTHCLPIERNWQILPDPGFECSAGYAQNIAIATGNVFVDALLIVVPVQIIRDVQMRMLRKVEITFLLSLGLFVMAMAIARCILSLGNGPGVTRSSTWVFREMLVTIFAVNAPAMTALFRRETWVSPGQSSGKAIMGKFGAFASDDAPTIGGSHPLGGPVRKGGEIYKMTEFGYETSSRPGTSKQVGAEKNRQVLPQSLR